MIFITISSALSAAGEEGRSVKRSREPKKIK
jgi:hypothetical protein